MVEPSGSMRRVVLLEVSLETLAPLARLIDSLFAAVKGCFGVGPIILSSQPFLCE